ncbi:TRANSCRIPTION FACTOR C3H FAMILY-RELATED [Salix purpurea]|uniref:TRANSCRIPTION FACTOR C3H FAMILY-RELATED n=1 Tax=Salix purpurea TaxID=77065 RepID=A0A9Q0P3I8_SALPP|nr:TRANSCRIPTION FACTOR C3H FAMILY-RELATED [Salix purpurea]
MIRLAFSPDNLIYATISKAKSDLGLNKTPVPNPLSPSQMNQAPVSDDHLQFIPITAVSSHPVSSPIKIRTAGSFWDAQVTGDQQQARNLDFGPPGYFYPEPALGPRTSRRSPSLPEFPVKICHYFNKGFCKHGNNCRYFHGHPMPESFSQIFSLNSNEIANDEHVISPGSLEKLELELTELLKSRRGVPVSIASLPMMYYEKYGRMLQAEGYLTESQRHGKAGYSLTKLLARLKNSIRLIDRPHGQHSVILTEDVPKYLEYSGERNDPGGIVAGSRQIYLTFPAESTFTEQDVSNYFSKFGPVQDVRIPCQQKRMFGFVTFVFAETVKQILAKGNPHHVCGARKHGTCAWLFIFLLTGLKIITLARFHKFICTAFHLKMKYAEKLQHPFYYSQPFLDGDSELHSVPRACDNSRLLGKQLMEEHEQALELERRRLSEFHFVRKPLTQQAYLGHYMEELKLSEARAEQTDQFPSAEHFNYWFDVLNNGSTSEEKYRHIRTNCSEQDSNQGVNLPESPFASAIGNGISTVI